MHMRVRRVCSRLWPMHIVVQISHSKDRDENVFLAINELLTVLI